MLWENIQTEKIKVKPLTFYKRMFSLHSLKIINVNLLNWFSDKCLFSILIFP